MTTDVFVLVEQTDGEVADTTFELLGKARELASAWSGETVAVNVGRPIDAAGLAADRVLQVSHPKLDAYTPEGCLEALAGIVADRDPKLVLVANTTIGMDQGAALAARWGKPVAAYVMDVRTDGPDVVATSQVFGGKLRAEVSLDGGQGVLTVVAGSFPADAGRASGSAPQVEEVTPPASLDTVASTFLAMIEPQAGDVDITAQDVLVAIGRGIESEDNIELAQEFADAIGAVVAASRPITDLGWLPKTRQVGKSGLKVKPRAYLMFGISGAPEHLEGMQDAELVIACNIDGSAPIFDVAHVGTTVDLFDLLPALTERVAG